VFSATGLTRHTFGGASGSTSNAIYAANGYGPTFGGGHDFYVVSNANANSQSYSNFGHTYAPQVGGTYGQASANTYLAGAYNFQVLEFETWALNRF